jgi:hypothetical protein
VVAGLTVVEPAAVVVATGDAAACAGMMTECSTGSVHVFGIRLSAVPAPILVPRAFNNGRRLISSDIRQILGALLPANTNRHQ